MTGMRIEPLELDRDLALLHAWVTAPHARFWGMQDWSEAQVREAYAEIVAAPHHDAWLGRADGRPAFLVETYDPAHSPLGDLAELRPGDLGMHVLVAPAAGDAVSGFTTDVLSAVLEHCFADPGVQRVVVEPDVRNAAIRAKNVAAGFVELREIGLPDKTAMLSVCTREDWRDAVTHLRPALLERAQRHLVAKAMAELAHERLLTPIAPDGRSPNTWRLDTGRSVWEFSARVLPLEHWVIDPSSLVRTVAGRPAALDVQALVVEVADALGIPERLLPVYLEELASTLAAATWKLQHRAVPVAELVEALAAGPAASAYQAVEAAMTEGHPAFIANNGRIGFGLDDYLAYAPETGSSVRLHWLAARHSATTLSLGRDESEEDLYAEELTEPVRARFDARLRALGLDPLDYLLLPVHPWQWRNKLAITFAPDLARRDLVHLGAGDDDYRAQQSIRTFFNADRPERHYVKTALSIQNMGFMRGLSPAYMAVTPAVNDWVAATVETDTELCSLGFSVLREVAAIGYTGDVFHTGGGTSAYRKMIAALWRESPLPRLARDERLATMASLLHRDARGDALVTALIKASPVDAAAWVHSYLTAYLRPLVHCLLAHDLAFMPHGENVIVVLRDLVPVRIVMKDIGEEVAVLAPEAGPGARPLPAEITRIRADVPDDATRALAIHTDVFDGVLRFVAAILDEDGVLDAAQFWAIVGEVIDEHAAAHPELASAVARYDLRRHAFAHSCLNRLQLRNTLQMVDIADQAASLLYAGSLVNPARRTEVPQPTQRE